MMVVLRFDRFIVRLVYLSEQLVEILLDIYAVFDLALLYGRPKN